jgi:hypothetical protein
MYLFWLKLVLMKRAVLLMFMSAMLAFTSVGFKTSIEKEKAPAAYAVPNSYDSPAILVAAISINVDEAETGESVPVYAPEAIWTNVIRPVDVEPPIAASAKVLINYSPLTEACLSMKVKGRCDQYSDRV